MANSVYNAAKLGIMNGSIDLVNDQLDFALVPAGYTFDPDHAFAAVTPEITATNYARITLTTKTFAQDNANDRAELDTDDQTWTSLGGAVDDTIQAVVVLDITTSTPICYIDTTTGTPSLPFTTNGGDLTLNINVEGILQLA